MVSNRIRNAAPGNRLRVRIPCPPLEVSMIEIKLSFFREKSRFPNLDRSLAGY